MAEGGFLVKFGNKKGIRCYAVSFDYDEWHYVINEKEKHKLPAGIKKIEIIFEEG